MRKAVAGFFEGRWEEERDEMMEEIEGAERRAKKKSQSSAGGSRKKKAIADEEDEGEALKAKVGWKCLASMLVRFSHALDDASAPIDEDQTMDDPSARESAEELKSWVDMALKGRIGSAVESLWDKVEKLRHWEGLVEFLGLDHSRGENEDKEDETMADLEGWKLEEDEEGCLIQVLVAGLRKVKVQAEKQVSLVSRFARRVLRFLKLTSLFFVSFFAAGRLLDIPGNDSNPHQGSSQAHRQASDRRSSSRRHPLDPSSHEPRDVPRSSDGHRKSPYSLPSSLSTPR